MREAKKRLEAERSANPEPVPRDRPKRAKQAKRRLDEELWMEVRASQAYEAYRARGWMRDAAGIIPPLAYRRRSTLTHARPTRCRERKDKRAASSPPAAPTPREHDPVVLKLRAALARSR